MMVQQQLQKEGEYVEKLRSIFMEADADFSGMVSIDEFEVLLRHAEVRKRLEEMHLKPSAMSGVFRLLSCADGDVSLDELIIGVTQLKHEEKAVGSVTLLYENQKVMRSLQRVESKLAVMHQSQQGLASAAA